MDMPSRHIPTSAFDDILSELGDDPAIPDPHGIRKAKSSKSEPHEPSEKPSFRQKLEGLPDPLNTAIELKKLGGLLAIFACFIGLGLALFVAFESLQTSSQASIQDSQRQLSDLKKEMEVLRNELENYQDDLYKELDLIEVSIHSLKDSKAPKGSNYKPKAIPHESELVRWRYLGNSQMGESHRGFFSTSKGTSTFEKGGLVLGDWRLNHITKDEATLSHPQGKSLVLKASKNE
jgi:hypothetical protein